MDLTSTAVFLLKGHIASSTRKTYAFGLREFHKFCISHNIQRVDEKSVLLFIASLFQKKMSPSTVHVYISAINNSLKERGLPSLDDNVILCYAMKGYSRFSKHQIDQRRPITLNLMALIKTALRHSSLPPFVQHLYWCACCFAFFGFLRASEFTTTSHSVYSSQEHTLLFKNISVREDRSIVLFLPHSKCSSNEHITLLPSDRSVCPVRAFHSFASFRSTLSSLELPFFMFPDRSFLSYNNFNFAVKCLLRDVPDVHLYSTHSFRIGAATSASAHGTSDAIIQKTGRWKSNTYRDYIRPTSPSRQVKHF